MDDISTYCIFPRSIRGILLFLLVISFLPIFVLQITNYYQLCTLRQQQQTYELTKTPYISWIYRQGNNKSGQNNYDFSYAGA